MGYRITYARVGNAEPCYGIVSHNGHRPAYDDVPPILARSVKEVAQTINRPLKSVRIACAEAREEGHSDFLL